MTLAIRECAAVLHLLRRHDRETGNPVRHFIGPAFGQKLTPRVYQAAGTSLPQNLHRAASRLINSAQNGQVRLADSANTAVP
jgi:hypothetical protein